MPDLEQTMEISLRWALLRSSSHHDNVVILSTLAALLLSEAICFLPLLPIG